MSEIGIESEKADSVVDISGLSVATDDKSTLIGDALRCTLLASSPEVSTARVMSSSTGTKPAGLGIATVCAGYEDAFSGPSIDS